MGARMSEALCHLSVRLRSRQPITTQNDHWQGLRADFCLQDYRSGSVITGDYEVQGLSNGFLPLFFRVFLCELYFSFLLARTLIAIVAASDSPVSVHQDVCSLTMIDDGTAQTKFQSIRITKQVDSTLRVNYIVIPRSGTLYVYVFVGV